MSFLLTRFSVFPSQQIIKFTPVQSVTVRNKSRYRKYGAEEGFAQKNEVRKEKWYRKQLPHRTGGGEWRESYGLTNNANNCGPLYDIPDYRFENGNPGVPR